jgi:hypothetical protein
MSSHRLMVGAVACLIPLCVALRPAPAGAGPESLAGRYVILPDQGDDIEAAIDKAVSGMNILTRRIARGRLRQTNTRPETVSIDVEGPTVVVQQDAQGPVRAAWDGTPTEWTDDDGEAFEVSVVWADSVLRQVFLAEDGQRVNEFRSSEGGQILTMRVVVSSPRLPDDVIYQLVFERVATGSGAPR